MTRTRPLPIGIEFFDEMIEKGYYYVDKTLFIRDLLDSGAKVSLFLRPRRFGKTLALSTLQCFFEDTGDDALNARRRALFDDLAVAKAGDAYRAAMTSRPVIFLTLKGAKQASFELAFWNLREAIVREFRRHNGAAAALTEEVDRDTFARISACKGSQADYAGALRFLCDCLYRGTGKKPALLIDEYDVPLDAAWLGGYYQEMIGFIRSLFESSLKTNTSLEFAVITGCLRVSRESVFTGLNNLEINSLLEPRYGEYFGFTQDEVDAMLTHYGLEARREDLRHWYDGYRVGSADVYNPWSVLNCLSNQTAAPDYPCRPYWAHTSSNDIVRRLIDHAGAEERRELETLLAGGAVEKPVTGDVTYAQLDDGSRIWDFLFFTGYLTPAGSRFENNRVVCNLRIPNTEVLLIFEDDVTAWFNRRARSRDLSALRAALLSGDDKTVSRELSRALMESISYNDYGEAFYHGFVTGLFRALPGYGALSNREAGTGRPDLLLLPDDPDDPCVVLEFKRAESAAGLAAARDAAVAQIAERDYAAGALAEGYDAALSYGVAFFRKRAVVAFAGRAEAGLAP